MLLLVGTLASTLGYVGVISKPDAAVLKPDATNSLKVGLPILNMGLPKSGDTSLLDMFSCAGLKASHYHCKRPSIDAKPYPTAVEASAKCRNETACRCKVFGNCTGTGLTTEPTDAYPLHNPFHYCKTYGMCDNEDLPKHLRPAGFENITYKDPYCGSCIMNNVLNEDAPLAGCGDFDVFAQLDGPWQEGKCFLPQIFSLNKLHEAYPDATLLLPTQPVAKWVKSHAMQRGSEMRQLLGACNLPTCGPACVDSDNLFSAFYTEHTLAIRTFAKKYGHTLIEVDVEAEDAGEQLADATGLGSSCWGQQSCKASCNFWHEMSNQRAKEEADKPNPSSSAEKAAEKKAAEKAAEKVAETAEKAEKIVRPKVMTEGTPESDDAPINPADLPSAPVVPGTPGFEAAPYVEPVVPGTPSFEAAPAADAPAADAPTADAPAAEAPAYAPGPAVPVVPEIPISVSSPEAAEKARREEQAARDLEIKRDEVARRHAEKEAAENPTVAAEKGPVTPSDTAPAAGLDDAAKNMAQAAAEAAAKATSEILAAGKKAEEERKNEAKAAKIVAEAEAVEREAAEAEPVQLPVAVTPLPLPAAASPLPLPVAPDVPEGLPIVPQLEAPKAVPVPEIPSSVSSPFAAAEAAKAATAVGNVTQGSVSGGDIGQTMANNAAAAAAEMVKATNEARDKMIDSLPPGEVADSSVVPGSTGDPFADHDEAAGTIKVGKVDKLGHVIEDDDVPNRVMTIGEESEKLKARRTRQKKWQKAESEKLRREAEKQEAEMREAEKLSKKRAKMKCIGPDGEPAYCSARGAKMPRCVGPNGEPAYCSAEGAKPAPA